MGTLPQALAMRFDAFSSTTRNFDLRYKRNSSVDPKEKTPIREPLSQFLPIKNRRGGRSLR
jgi:hypothetical protein